MQFHFNFYQYLYTYWHTFLLWCVPLTMLNCRNIFLLVCESLFSHERINQKQSSTLITFECVEVCVYITQRTRCNLEHLCPSVRRHWTVNSLKMLSTKTLWTEMRWIEFRWIAVNRSQSAPYFFSVLFFYSEAFNRFSLYYVN